MMFQRPRFASQNSLNFKRNKRTGRGLRLESLEQRRLLAEIHGALFNDVTRDGLQSTGEAGLEGWTVFLDENQNGQLDVAREQFQLDTPTALNDDDETLIPLNVANPSTQIITDLNVSVSITHTWISDLLINLISPQGTVVELFDALGGDGHDLRAEFDDEARTSIAVGSPPFNGDFRPMRLLSAFDGENPQGVWTLQVFDLATADEGTLDGLTLSFEVGAAEPVTMTGPRGEYAFNGLSAGTYVVDIVPPPGWSQTSPLQDTFTNVVADPSFESGTLNPSWTQSSTNFGTLLCDFPSCGDEGGAGARSGLAWIWFGGVDAFEVGSIEQTLSIPSDAATLSFWLEIPSGSGLGTDYLSVKIDGVELFRVMDTDAIDYSVYELVSLDISGFADGGQHSLLFQSETNGGGIEGELTSFLVDHVSLMGTAALPSPHEVTMGPAEVRSGVDFGYVSSFVADDHGNDADAATLVDVGATVAGVLERPGDDDWFQFFAVSGAEYTISTNLNSLPDSVLTLFDADGQTELLVNDDDPNGGTGSRIEWIPLESGDYYVRVSAAADNFGSYELRLDGPADANHGEIHGTLFHDEDGDGVQGAEESGLENWIVYLDRNQNGILDSSQESFLHNETTAINDNGETRIQMLVDTSAPISDLNVTIDITHPYMSDLTLNLISPLGTSVTLIDAMGNDGDNMESTVFDDEAAESIAAAAPPYSGSYRPVQNLAGFDGENPRGVWTLQILDQADFDVGTLNSWTLTFAGDEVLEPFTATSADGAYSFTGLLPNIYAVAIQAPPGWQQTHPLPPATHQLILELNEIAQDVDFGYAPLPPAEALLPDLIAWDSAADDYLHGWSIDEISQPGATLLRLTTAVPNIGQGPMELRGGATNPDDTQEVFQRIHDAGGGFQDVLAGTFEYHEEHGHIHFEGFTQFNLREVTPENGVGPIVAGGEKTSFCLLDVDVYHAGLPGHPSDAHYNGCDQVQGISVGWADVYDQALPDQWIDITGVPTGFYWLEVVVDPDNRLMESDETNNTTQILIELDFSDDHGSDAAGATHVPINHTVSGNVEAAGDEDWFSFNATAGADYEFSTTLISLSDSVLRLYDTDGETELAMNDDAPDGGLESLIEWTAPDNGVYFIIVEGYESETGAYDLTISGPGDDHGNDAGSSTPVRVNSTAPGSIEIGGDEDWFNFPALENTSYTLETHLEGVPDTILTLYDQDGESVLELSVDDGDGLASRISWTAPAAGTYFLQVQAFGDRQTGGYSLDVFIEDVADSVSPTVLSVEVNVGLVDPPNLNGMPQPSSWSRQHSDIRSLQVTFSEPILDIDPSHLTLINLGVDAPQDPDTEVPLETNQILLDGNVLFIQFDHYELPDGVYSLEISLQVTDLSGNSLDGDANGAGGDAYHLVGDDTNGLFKLLADWNGDRGATIFDFPAFAYWFGTVVGPDGAPEYMDIEADGGVSIFDFPRFAANFGAGIVLPAPPLAAADAGNNFSERPRRSAPAVTEPKRDIAIEGNNGTITTAELRPVREDAWEFAWDSRLDRQPTLEEFLADLAEDVAQVWR